jgi:hypothetical protein
MKSRELLPLSVLLSAVLLCGCVSFDGDGSEEPGSPADSVLKMVEKDPERGFHWPYCLYIPETQVSSPVPIILIANNTPRPDDDVTVHYRQARNKVAQYRHMADRTGFPLLIPAIPRLEHEFPGGSGYQNDAWVVGVQSLNRNALLTPNRALKRMDLQVMHMLKHASTVFGEHGIAADGKAVVFGFSSSGTFAHRFALLHPDVVRLEIAGAPGGWYTLPLESYRGTRLRYPIGIADLESLTGSPFTAAQYRQIPKLWFVGAEDEDDAVPYLDAYAYEDRVTITRLFGEDHMERYRRQAELLDQRGMNTDFHVFESAGHEITSEAWETVYAFIRRYCRVPVQPN